MAESSFFPIFKNEPADFPALADSEVLKRAIAKIVVMGEQVGVSADQMILLLKSGLTVSELLGYADTRITSRQAESFDA